MAEPVVKLRSVYRLEDAAQILFELLKERSDDINISHSAMPSWRSHLAFIRSRPYSAWYLVEVDKEFAGAIYLSKTNEIGIFLFRSHHGRGLGKKAIKALMKRHPRGRYLANINPRNDNSIAMFEGMGFRHIQNTYELDG